MASIATCPQCAKQMAMPDEVSHAECVQCPLCDAIFLIANVQRLPLPVARILEVDETSPATAAPSLETSSLETPPREAPSQAAPSLDMPTEDLPGVGLATEATADETDSEDSGPPAGVSQTAPVSSWETRLKNALQADTAEPARDEKPNKTTAEEQPVGGEPDFEFHLDPPDAPEPLETAPGTIDLQPREASSELFQAELESAPVSAEFGDSEFQSPAPHDDPSEVNLKTVPRRRSTGASLIKPATILVSSGVIGSLLGLYALLWIKGPSADYLNLAQYLPAALLPASVDSPEEPAAAEQRQTLQADASQPPVEQPSLEPGPENTRLDTEVRVATAEQPIETPPPPASVSPEEFSELVAVARQAASELAEGDLKTNESVARMGKAYMACCRLAEHFDFALQSGLTAKSQAEVELAKELFQSAAARASARGDLATIVSRWWGYNGRPNQGIFFVGRIQDIQPVGAKTLCFVTLDDLATPLVIPVLLDPVLLERTPDSKGGRIAVVGSILQDPNNTLPDFEFQVPQIAVAQYSYHLRP